MTRLLRFRMLLLTCLFFQISSAQNASGINPWVISAVPDPANYYGVTVANGMIGIVSSPQPFQVKDVVLAGAYDLYGRGRVSNFLKSFNLLNMHFNVDGAETNAKNISSLKQTLDMQRASFTTSFNIQDKASVTYTYYALRQLPFTVLMDITVVAKKDIEIEPASVMEAQDALRDVQNYYNEIDRPHVVISLLTSTAKSPTGKLLMCASNTFIFNEPHGQEPRLIHEMWDNNMHLLKFKRKLKAGETYRFSIAGSSITSAHDEDPLNESERLTIFAKLQGTDRLIAFHEKAWSEIWKTDIQVTGEEQSQQDIHSMLYHLYSFTREGTTNSLSPMGLSGLGYNGHIFWDADLWMFPALLVLHPEMAKSMIEYRY